MSIKYGEESSPEFKEQLAKLSPEKRKQALEVAQTVKAEVQKVAAELDHSMDEESRIRRWSKRFFGRTLTVSDIEEFQNEAQNVPVNTIQTYTARGCNQIFYLRTSLGHIVKPAEYIVGLEKVIINMQDERERFNEFTNTSFWGLIKLAFRKLFNRSKV